MQPILTKQQEQKLEFQKILIDFLRTNKCTQTIQMFQQESQINDKNNELDIDLDTPFINYFNKGQNIEFFNSWNKYIPKYLLSENMSLKKLEFYLQIHFILYPLQPTLNKNPQTDCAPEKIAQFKIYLENSGAELSKTTEFLPYYALPYIKKPLDHPALKTLFTQEWIENLRKDLQENLKNLCDKKLLKLQELGPKQHLLEQIYFNYSNQQTDSTKIDQYEQKIQQLEQRNQELVKTVKDINSKCTTLQNNYKELADVAKQSLLESSQKWVAMSKELAQIAKTFLQALENFRNNTPINQKYFDLCVNKLIKYEEFLNTSLEELIQKSQDLSVFEYYLGTTQFEDDHVMQNQQNDNANQQNEQYPNGYPPLNFDKIQQTLISNEDEILTCALLQALRFRMAKSRTISVRREVIFSYYNEDLLGCLQNNNSSNLIEVLLKNSSTKIQEFILLNKLNNQASDYYGRSYLSATDKVTNTLNSILKTEVLQITLLFLIQKVADSISRKNALGALQKLSLRKRPQLLMIQQDVLKWLINILKNEKNTLTEYSYEYLTALLMNLSLRKEGRKKFEEIIDETLNIIINLMEHSNMQVRTFVNGTLYSLLSNPKIKQKANEKNFLETMGKQLNQADEKFTKQIQYIICQLTTENTDEEEQIDESQDEENENDDIEDDDDFCDDPDIEDTTNFLEGYPTGEILLKNEFYLEGEQAFQQTQLIKQLIDESKITRQEQQNKSFLKQKTNQNDENLLLFQRPTTPNLISSQLNKQKQKKGQINQVQQIQQVQFNQNQQRIESGQNQQRIESASQKNQFKSADPRKGLSYNNIINSEGGKKIESREKVQSKQQGVNNDNNQNYEDIINQFQENSNLAFQARQINLLIQQCIRPKVARTPAQPEKNERQQQESGKQQAKSTKQGVYKYHDQNAQKHMGLKKK